MNNFKKSIQAEVEGIKEVYESRNIYLRENNNTGKCMSYFEKNIEKEDDTSVRVFLANIEDESDIISYKTLALPGGRIRYFNEQKDEFYLYTFENVFQALSGEVLSPHAMITKRQIDKLIEQYRSEKALMKYVELKRITVNGLDAYIGKYIEQGRFKKEELFAGNVLSRFGLVEYIEDINNQEGQVIATTRYFRNFRPQYYGLKFTTKALQNIIEKDKNRGK